MRARTYLVLDLRHLRALEVVRVEGVADLDVAGVLREAVEELVVDLLVDEDARAGTADLAMVVAVRPPVSLYAPSKGTRSLQDTESGPLDGLVEVAVIENDVGRLAAELESDVLEVGLGGGLHDLAAH